MSFSRTTRGLSPAWIARMPSSVIARKCSSSADSCLSRLATGRKTTLAERDAEQRGDEGGRDRRAERLGLVEVLEHVHEAEDRADDAHRRGEAAGLLERLGAPAAWRLRIAVVLGLEHLGDELGVRAVDDELQALRVNGSSTVDSCSSRASRPSRRAFSA